MTPDGAGWPGATGAAPAPGGAAAGIPPAGLRPRPGLRLLRLSALALASLLFAVAALGVRNSLTDEAAPLATGEVVAEITGPEADAVLRALRRPAEPDPPAPPAPLAPAVPIPAPILLPPALPAPVVEEDGALWRRKRESPILVYGRFAGAGRGVDAGPGIGAGPDPGAGLGVEPAAGSLADRLQAADFPPVRAEVLDGLDSRILEGTVIACILEGAISSALPGMTLCRTRNPVYSETGRFEVIPAGSRVIGEYRGGVESGHARIFVLWRRLITPDGVSVRLASPGTGPLGRGGHAGLLDQKWPQRFAAAWMVSLVAGARAQSGSPVADAAAAAVQATAADAISRSLPGVPELVKHQGENIAILVARDVDFGAAMDHRFDLAGRQSSVLVFDRR